MSRNFPRNKMRSKQRYSLTDINYARPGNPRLLQYFIYLMVESQKLTCRVRGVKIVLSNISVMVSIDKLLKGNLNSALKRVTIKRKIVPKIICSKKENISINQQKRKRADSGGDTTEISVTENKNAPVTKRRADFPKGNTPKRLKTQIETSRPATESETKDVREIADETNPDWQQFHCNNLGEALRIVRREWDVKHLSNLHVNLSHCFRSNGLYRPQYCGDRTAASCTLIFDSAIKDLHQNLLDIKSRVIGLQRQLKRCLWPNRNFYRINRDIAQCEQRKRELKNTLARLYEASVEIESLNKVYEEHCCEYRKHVLLADRCNLDLYKQFYDGNDN